MHPQSAGSRSVARAFRIVQWPSLRPGAALCHNREMPGRRSPTAARGLGICPRKLIMAVWPRARVLPSGRPQIARRWFSNWLVTQPSMVQWPELWTRGAISLAINRPFDDEKFDREHADVVEGIHDALADSAARVRSSARVRERCNAVAQDPAARGYWQTADSTRSRPPRSARRRWKFRGRTPEISRRSSPDPPIAVPRGIELCRVRDERTGPCRHSPCAAS